MKDSTLQAVSDLIDRYPALDTCRRDLEDAVRVLCESFAGGHKLLTCGNGGSAADAEHIVGELMKGFLLPRRLTGDIAASIRETAPESADYLLENLQGTLPAVSLVAETALTTAFANDQAADLGFAQQVLGLGSEEKRCLRPSGRPRQTRHVNCPDGKIRRPHRPRTSR